jgi:shikimate dehydrogenase
MTDIYGVMGRPVLHSMSPQMHNAAFRALGLDACYIRVAAASKEEGLSLMHEVPIRGMNVTAPFKDIGGILDGVDPVAERIGAVNTVLSVGGRTTGHNTDAHGIARSFLANGVAMKGRKAVVLGAGGASRAAIVAMLDNGAEVVVANRTPEKAEALAREFGVEACPLAGAELAGAMRGAGLVIGCLATAQRAVPHELLSKDMAVLEANYATGTALCEDAAKAGCHVIDGREWLLHQGAEAFEMFTGREAPLDAMRDAVYSDENGRGKRNIALTGFMGSGKDTISKRMSHDTGMRLLDLDSEIEGSAGMSVKEIFRTRGEEGFRAMEKDELARLEGKEGLVVNCGGGAVLAPENREMLARGAAVVWLWADPRTIMERVAGDGSRPLLEAPDPEGKISELLSARMGAYAAASDMMICTAGKSPAETAERILYEVRKAFPDIRAD